MRKYLVMALALCVAFAGSAVAIASDTTKDDVTQNFDAKATSNKQDKKKRGQIKSLKIDVSSEVDGQSMSTSPIPNGAVPPKVDLVTFKFYSDFRFNPGDFDGCDKDDIAGKSPSAAKDECDTSKVDALVGDGKAKAWSYKTPTLGSNGVVSSVVTAFNGKSKNTLLLHVFTAAANNTTIIEAKLKGTKLTVPVDALPLQAKLVEFSTDVGKKDGKDYYIEAKCSGKKWKQKSEWRYEKESGDTAQVHDAPGTINVRDDQSCKQK